MAALMPPGRGAAAADAWSVAIATAALLIYGVLQERVMTRAWGEGDSAELFPHSAFLVLCNRLLTVIALAAAALVRGSSLAPVAPLRAYCLVSASNMLSTLCQYEALKYVSFVTQTLAKTGKALPVLLWGRLVGGRRYRREQYAHALAITAGCAVFVLGGDITSAAAGAGAGAAAAPAASVVGGLITYGAGLGLLGVYLAADGWTSTAQEALYRLHGTPIREQLLYTTTFSAAYSLAAALAAGQMRPALGFLARHPDAAAAVLGLSAMSTVIQVAISHVLAAHGALVFALMMTTRQCASVLLSSLLFGHALTLMQWLGVGVVFAALYHQKSRAVMVQGRHSAAGRLPQSRQSTAGVGDGGEATPLLSKQPSTGGGALHMRGVSHAGGPPGSGAGGGGGVPHVRSAAAVGSGSVGGAPPAGGQSAAGGGSSPRPAAALRLQLPTSSNAAGGSDGGGGVVLVPPALPAGVQALTPRMGAQASTPRATPQLSLSEGIRKLWSPPRLQQSDSTHTE